MQREALWRQLRAAGLVDGAMPAAADDASPWYLQLMQGFAGWLAALFLFAFFAAALSGLLDNEAALATVGLFCCAVACGVQTVAAGRDFVQQFALAVSLCGQCLVIIALAQWLIDGRSWAAFFFAVAAFETLLALLMSGFLPRLLCSWAALTALLLALVNGGWGELSGALCAAGFVLLWQNEPRWGRHAARWRPLGYALALLLVQINLLRLHGVSVFELFGAFDADRAGAPWRWPRWLNAALLAATLLWLSVGLLRRAGAAPGTPAGVAALLGALLVGALALPAAGSVAAVLIMLTGFGAGSRPLTVLGAVALVGFLAHYYYSLDLTLLVKSLLLIGVGASLLAARVALRRWPVAAQEPS